MCMMYYYMDHSIPLSANIKRESVVPAPPVSNVGSNSQDDEVILLHRGPGSPSTDQ